jgi:hypothetical protein
MFLSLLFRVFELSSANFFSPYNSLAFLLLAILLCRFLGGGSIPWEESSHVDGVVALLVPGSAPVPIVSPVVGVLLVHSLVVLCGCLCRLCCLGPGLGLILVPSLGHIHGHKMFGLVVGSGK